MTVEDAAAFGKVRKGLAEVEAESGKKAKEQKTSLEAKLLELETQHMGSTLRLAQRLEQLTGLESRLTILGYLQRGGTPSAADRLLATRLGTAAARYIDAGTYGAMVAVRGEGVEPVLLEKVVGQRRIVPLDHPWIDSARSVGTALGD
jgi:6-phosphofructokinase 1